MGRLVGELRGRLPRVFEGEALERHKAKIPVGVWLRALAG